MQSNNVKIAFASHDVELLDIRHFSIHESMNELFEISILAYSKDDNIDLDSIVGKGAALRIETPNYQATTGAKIWSGVVADMSQVHAEPPPGLSAYHVLLVPSLWRTTLRRNSRIFQHMTIPEIVQKVLSEWQLTPQMKLQAQYKKLEYCVQYGETDFAFVSRLLEDAGISFYFTQAADKGKGEDITKLVLNDAPQKNDQRKGPLAYAGHQTPRFGGDMDFCATVTVSQRVKPGKFTVRDFDFRLRPDTPLLSKSTSGTREDVYEQYDYAPGVFWSEPGDGGGTPVADDKGVARTDTKEADALMKREMEADRRRRLLVSFNTNALDLAPGSIVGINQESTTTKDHPRADLAPDKKILLTQMSLEGEHNGEWTMNVAGVFAENTHRPERRTPKPRIYGVQSAIVVGPAGQDIYTDEFGRVRVQFHWDREGKYDDNSSCWMRVSQAWAGGGFGVVNIPRVGHEVLVEFFEGDPDRPIITGRVYNATTQTPYKLPDHKTQSGWKSDSSPGGGGYNEIMFEDAKGNELIHIQAEKDLSYVVKDNESADIGNARSARIGMADSLSVGQTRATKVGMTDSTDVGQTHTISVGPTTGTKMTADQTIIVTTGGASIKLAGKDIFINAQGEIHLHGEKEVHISSHSGTVEIQGGPNVTLNPPGESAPEPHVDTVQAAKPPDPPGPGGTSGPPFKPSGGGSIDKPGGIEDVTIDKSPSQVN